MSIRVAHFDDGGRLVAHGVGVGTTIRHGIASGLLGAAALAIWFFIHDYEAARPLYTPTVLGNVLVHGASLGSLDSIQPSWSMTLLFTLVHGAVFVGLGIALAWAIAIMERRPTFWIGMLMVFVTLQLGFIAFALTFPAITNGAIEMRQIIVGNFLAAMAMALYAWRERPEPLPENQT